MNTTDFYVKVYPYLYDSGIKDYRLSDEEPFISKVYAINDSESESEPCSVTSVHVPSSSPIFTQMFISESQLCR